MAREVKQTGVELHGNSYRYRMRITDEKKTRTAAYERWPFVEKREADRQSLGPKDPLRRENALANANAFALQDRHRRKSPQRAGGIQDAEGTLLEWLFRYQMEALDRRRFDKAYIPLLLDEAKEIIERKRRAGAPSSLPASVPGFNGPEIGAESVYHDKSQIRSIIRLAKDDLAIDDMLHTQVEALGSQQFTHLLGAWSGGTAKAKTKRKLLSTFSAVWNHHASHLGMELLKPWRSIKIPGDGTKPKARALTKTDLDKLDAELGRLHPTVQGAIEFLRWTGARRGEASKLRWENIKIPSSNLSMPVVLFERTKARRGSYKERFTYLQNEVLATLAFMLTPPDKDGVREKIDPETFDWVSFPWPKTGWVFPAPKNPKQRIDGGTIYQAFTRCIEHAGVAHASPHHLRHTRATILSATLTESQAMELLGHDDARTFAIYRHLAEEAGYMVRDRKGNRVNADDLKSQEAIIEALSKFSEEEQIAMLMKSKKR